MISRGHNKDDVNPSEILSTLWPRAKETKDRGIKYNIRDGEFELFRSLKIVHRLWRSQPFFFVVYQTFAGKNNRNIAVVVKSIKERPTNRRQLRFC